MLMKHVFLTCVITVSAQAVHADQLCQSNGSGCVNVTWSCGSFTVPEDLMCKSTLAAVRGDVKQKGLHSGGTPAIKDFESDIAQMRRRKAKMIPILPNPKMQKAGGCPPICMEPPIVEPPVE
ncbi:hypothetical protein [Celeribacter marinus]|uniref:hypothetical protein n=1 Tax=Celeribacter marinus TaxID=1397108 RepID=UPI0031788A85